MANVGYPAAKQELTEVEAAAGALGFEVVALEITRPEDIAPAFDGIKDRADVLYVVADALVNSYGTRINTLALGGRLPAMYGSSSGSGARAGFLLCYGASYPGLFRRTAELVDKILRGAKPSDIPVEEPTKFELVINLKTARALGIEVPYNLLVLADEVIE